MNGLGVFIPAIGKQDVVDRRPRPSYNRFSKRHIFKARNRTGGGNESMSIQALLLVVTAALVHAVWNLATKKANGRLPFIWLVSVSSAVIYLPFVAGQLIQREIPQGVTLYVFAAVSAVLHLLYFVVLQRGYRKADLSLVYPLARGTGPLLSASGAILVLGERPDGTAICGIVLIILGILMMTGLKLRFSGDAKLKAGAFYGVATGLFIAAYTLWDKVAVADYRISALLLTFASMVLPTFILLPQALRLREEVRREIQVHWKHILAVAVLSPLSYILVLVALKTTPVSYVAPAREISIVFGVFFGANFLQEADARRRAIATVVILAGISLLAVG